MIDKNILVHFKKLYESGINVMDTLDQLNNVFDDPMTDEYIIKHLVDFSVAVVQSNQAFLNQFDVPSNAPEQKNIEQPDAEFEQKPTEEELRIKESQEKLESEYNEKIKLLEKEAKEKEVIKNREEDNSFNLDAKLKMLKSRIVNKDED